MGDEAGCSQLQPSPRSPYWCLGQERQLGKQGAADRLPRDLGGETKRKSLVRKVSRCPHCLTGVCGQMGVPFNRVGNSWAGQLAQTEGSHELVLGKLGVGMSGEH